jgi:hypothetical protein
MIDNSFLDDEYSIKTFSIKKNEDYIFDGKSIIPIEIIRNIFSDHLNKEYVEENIDGDNIINKADINKKNKNKEKHDIQIIISNDKNNEIFSTFSSINKKNKNNIKFKIHIIKNKNHILNGIKVFRLASNKVALGRKRKDIKREMVVHDKFSDDNLVRKVKCTLIDILSSLINELLKKYYTNNNGKKENKKELFKMNQNQIISSKADYNKNLLSKNLKEIFSHRISTKYTKYSPEHNKIVINQILNEKNRDIKMKFENIFNLTFLDCLEHFRGTKYLKELEGMTNLVEYCNKFENDQNYICKFKYYVDNFETIIYKKKLRNRAKKNQSIERQ